MIVSFRSLIVLSNVSLTPVTCSGTNRKRGNINTIIHKTQEHDILKISIRTDNDPVSFKQIQRVGIKSRLMHILYIYIM